MVLGNKRDKSNREVPYNMAMQYARERNFGFMEVSAKTGFGVNEVFNRLISEIYKFQNIEKVMEENMRNPTKPPRGGMSKSTTTIGGSEEHKGSFKIGLSKPIPTESDDDSLIVSE